MASVLNFASWSAYNIGLSWKERLVAELDKDQTLLGLFMGLVGKGVSQTLKDLKHADLRNDGLVETNACAYWTDDHTSTEGRHWYGIGKEWPEYGPKNTHDPADTHILARINHVEECGLFPDRGSGIVLQWMRNMMCREITSAGNLCADAPKDYVWPATSGLIGDACSNEILMLAQGSGCKNVDLFKASTNQQTVQCCNWQFHGTCQTTLMDYAGKYLCPGDCKNNPIATLF